MRFILCSAFAATLAGCTAPTEVSGPFTGRPRYFTVDGLTMPRSRAEFADDLNGDGRPDNQLGAIAQVLDGQGFGPSGLPAGAALTLRSDSAALDEDAAAGVEWRSAPGAEPIVIGGRLAGGRFVSNRTRSTAAPAIGTVVLPLVDGAEPAALDVIGLELELAPDGAGGYDGALHGAIDPAQAIAAAWRALNQLVAARPALRSLVVGALDTDGDGQVSLDELAGNPLVRELAGPDVQLFDDAGRWAPSPRNAHRDSLSLGVRFHLAPKAR